MENRKNESLVGLAPGMDEKRLRVPNIFLLICLRLQFGYFMTSFSVPLLVNPQHPDDNEMSSLIH